MSAPSIWFARLSAIDDRAAVEGGDEPRDADCPVLLDADLGAGRHVGALLDAASDAEPGSFVPAGPFGSGAEDVGEPLVLEMSQTQLHRIGAEPVGELVDVRLAGEVVGGGPDAAVRALAQRRVGGLVRDALVGNRVGAADAGSAGADVQEVPRGHGAVGSGAAADVDDGCWPDVRRLELLCAAPVHLHGLAVVTREPGSFDRHFATVLPAEGRSGGRRDHAHVLFREAELFRQLCPDAERALRPRPHR